MVRVVLLLLTLVLAASATTVVVDLELLTDGDTVVSQYPGFTFQNLSVLSAGISLNEFEFPPHSGTNVGVDTGGPVTVVFGSLAATVKGYFTYLTPVTLIAFGKNGNELGRVTSGFGGNLAISGDPGSAPNEVLSLTFASGIASIRIEGDPNGGSFVLDDLSVVIPQNVGVPEPSTLALLLAGGVALLVRRTRG